MKWVLVMELEKVYIKLLLDLTGSNTNNSAQGVQVLLLKYIRQQSNHPLWSCVSF